MAKRKAPKTKIVVSDALAEVIGTEGPLLMTELTKKVWVYIKKHKLNDGRIITGDAVLADVIGKRPIDMMQLGKKLREHYEVVK